MFDFGAGELLVIGIVALVVIGPKELPGVLRQVGKATGKMRQMAGEFRSQFDEAMREAELHEATKHLAGFKDDLVSTVTQLNPVTDIKNEIHSTTAMLNAPLTPAEPVVSPPVAVPAEEAAKPKRVRKKIGVGATDPSLESVVPAASPTAPRKSAAAKSSASTKADTARLSDTIPSKPRADRCSRNAAKGAQTRQACARRTCRRTCPPRPARPEPRPPETRPPKQKLRPPRSWRFRRRQADRP